MTDYLLSKRLGDLGTGGDTNEADIATNTADIATNVAGIAANVSDISAVETRLDALEAYPHGLVLGVVADVDHSTADDALYNIGSILIPADIMNGAGGFLEVGCFFEVDSTPIVDAKTDVFVAVDTTASTTIGAGANLIGKGANRMVSARKRFSNVTDATQIVYKRSSTDDVGDSGNAPDTYAIDTTSNFYVNFIARLGIGDAGKTMTLRAGTVLCFPAP